MRMSRSSNPSTAPGTMFDWPFLLLVGATAAVFFGTQRELFQQTIGIVTAVAATLPTLVKAVSLVGGKIGGGGG